MGVSARPRPRTSPAFVTTPYCVKEAEFAAERPTRGPCWDDTEPCRVGLDHRRQRKTGPPWGWVAVMRCVVHGRAFTVYPPGHVPYGQVPLVPIAPDGGPAISTDDEAAVATLFDAARDAARDEPALWPREEAPGATRSTQARRLERSAEILGLIEGVGPGADVAAAVTHLPCGGLVETTRELAAASGLMARGRQVARTFRELVKRAGRAVMDRLAVLGHLTGCWGEPYRWDPNRGRLLALGKAFWAPLRAGTQGSQPSPPTGGSTHDPGVRKPP